MSQLDQVSFQTTSRHGNNQPDLQETEDDRNGFHDSMVASALVGPSGGFSSTSAAILKMKTHLAAGVNPVPGPSDASKLLFWFSWPLNHLRDLVLDRPGCPGSSESNRVKYKHFISFGSSQSEKKSSYQNNDDRNFTSVNTSLGTCATRTLPRLRCAGAQDEEQFNRDYRTSFKVWTKEQTLMLQEPDIVSNIQILEWCLSTFFRELQTSWIDEGTSTTSSMAKTIPTAKFHFRTLTTRRIITSIQVVRMKQNPFSKSCFLQHVSFYSSLY